MAPASSTTLHSHADNAQIWTHLKTAIVHSSGFQRWLREQSVTADGASASESLVRRYLRETLETLAY
jgi:hypothetical protein